MESRGDRDRSVPLSTARGDGTPGPAWWEKKTGEGSPAPKQRWNKAQKDAARARRAQGNRPRGERAAS